MVELLDPGTEAETCHMAVRSMNGRKGIIVCYDPSNQRYILELDKGDMMSLRIRNVRKITPTTDEHEEGGANDREDREPILFARTGYDANSRNVSSLPRAFPPDSKVEDDNNHNNNSSNNSNDRNNSENQQIHHQSIFESISPTNALLAALAAYFYLQGDGSIGVTNNAINYGDIRPPVAITLAAFSYLAWEWGTKPNYGRPRGEFEWTNLCLRLSRCDFWELAGISGLALWCLEFPVHAILGVGTALFFVWKFGTRNGRTAFGWDNVKERAADLSVWEALMLARALRGGLGALNHVAHPHRPRRR